MWLDLFPARGTKKLFCRERSPNLDIYLSALMMDVSDIGNLASDSSAQTVDQLAVSAAVATAQQQQQMGGAVGCDDDPSP
ncbi:Uncharacterized protein BM_BM8034 [Brugia malayi]|uniref:Uncharacterized protein n=1 Tax=Brugia malayi TaxID=6279 RepID=A0A4E9FWX6_BRUMA|nr:Uncharacterized protein BM_BM8034 [Brugia malayi]VIP00270.1 Uncharacterized protein BM_BM8034 [Brugia malayi]